jgi:hypothetical protein
MTLHIRLTDDETQQLIASHTALVDGARALNASLPWGLFAGAGIDVDDEPLDQALTDAAVVEDVIRAAERRALAELTTKETRPRG